MSAVRNLGVDFAQPGAPGLIKVDFMFALTPVGIDKEIVLAASLLYLAAHRVPMTADCAAHILGSRLPVSALRHEDLIED